MDKKGNSCNGLKHTHETAFLTTQFRPVFVEEINWIQQLGQIKDLFSMALAQDLWWIVASRLYILIFYLNYKRNKLYKCT